MHKKFIALLVIACATLLPQSVGAENSGAELPTPIRALVWLNHSKPSRMCNQAIRKIATKLGLHQHPLKPASQEYQAFATEAKQVFNLTERHIPISKFGDKDINEVAGFSHPCGIYLNEYSLSMVPYGVRRFTVFHEMAHEAHHSDIPFWCGAAALTALLPIPAALDWQTTLKMGNISLTFPLLNIATGFAKGLLLRKLLSISRWYCERQADTEGLRVLRCHKCMYEVAFCCDEDNTKKGYLGQKTKLAMARDFYHKEPKILCEYHAINADESPLEIAWKKYLEDETYRPEILDVCLHREKERDREKRYQSAPSLAR